MANGLVSQPLGPQGGFNWVYLVELLVCAILAVFFLFYFNRLIATLLSYGIRAFTWHYYRAYIDITSLQLSILGGRLFLKRIRYQAHNETILVHDAQITWRYWLRAVQETEVFQEEDKARSRNERPSSSSTGRSERLSPQQSSESENAKTRDRSTSRAERNTTKPKKELPCRILVKVAGVEAFIYNRSPLYDSIVDATCKKAQRPSSRATGPTKNDHVQEASARPTSAPTDNEDVNEADDPWMVRPGTRSTHDSAIGEFKSPSVPAWLRILPVRIECKKAAAAVGNENTTSIVTAKTESAAGTIDAGRAGPLDFYKLLFAFDIKNVKVELKPNRDFKLPPLDAAHQILRERELAAEEKRRPNNNERVSVPVGLWRNSLARFLKWKRKKSSGGSIRAASIDSETVIDEKFIPHVSEGPDSSRWHGLARYLDDDERNEHDEWTGVEYAKASTLVDSEQISMLFYWDIPGPVPDFAAVDAETREAAPQLNNDINGSQPPAYGMDLFVHGGFIVYGPWADRQRVSLQHAFFPQPYVDAIPAEPLKPGQWRVCTVFKIFISIEADVVLRIPCRESSKDHEWLGRADMNRMASWKPDAKQNSKIRGRKSKRNKRDKGGKQGVTPGADVRPYAWLDVTVKRNSTVNYILDMFPRLDGFNNRLDLDVRGTEISSSVNHGLLWRTGPLAMFADLSNPLTWNTLRKWPFKIVCDDLELFILRDHMFLITDLVNDWSSGPPPEFYTFVPYEYEMNLTFRDFCMYLNVNDGNIINEPSDLDRNLFLTLEGRNLNGVLDIPLKDYRPEKSGITFDVLSQDMSMRFLAPLRSTYHSLIKDKLVAELPRLTLKGSYEANTATKPGLTDVLRMDLVGTGLRLKAYGFLLRYFINVKENYFGDYMHFKTLEEFQNVDGNVAEKNAQTMSVQPTAGNELDVVLCIQAVEATVMAPTKLYSIDEFVRVDLPQGNIDLRITSYYMDLTLNFSPISIFSGVKEVKDDPDDSMENESATQIFIAGVDLLGHRLFGLAPNEPAYVNDWEVSAGAITGECTSRFIKTLAFAARALMFTFADDENVWPLGDPYTIHDIVFLSLKTDIIRLWMHVGKEAFMISTRPVRVDFNDWAGDVFSQHVSVLVPDLTVACVDGRDASRHRLRRRRKTPVETYAFLQTSVSLSMVGRKARFAEERGYQQAHLREHDQRTRRALFLQHRRPNMRATLELAPDVEPAAIPFPGLPPPINYDGVASGRPISVKSASSDSTDRTVSSKSSKASLSGSIRAAALSVPFRTLRLKQSPPSSQRESSLSSSRPSSSLRQRLPDDEERAELGLPPSTMAFSSRWSDPYFPLDTIQPDDSKVPTFETLGSGEDDGTSETDPIEGAIHDPELDDDAEHISIFIKLVPGIRAYAEPKVAESAATLLDILQPKDPETILDAYQVSVLNRMSAQQATHEKKAKVVEVQVSLPSALLRVANGEHDGTTGDEVNLRLRKLDFMLRSRTRSANSKESDLLLMHITFESLNMRLNEISASNSIPPVIEASIEDALIWITLSNMQSLHMSIRDVSAKAHSAQAEYFTAFLLRVLGLVKDLQPRFQAPLTDGKQRLQTLIYTLLQHSDGLPDPVFISKLNYLLRAFPDHFQNQDSWKVISRMRNMLLWLPVHVYDRLLDQFKGKQVQCPEDLSSRIIEVWDQHDNWDVPNVAHTIAFVMLIGRDVENLWETDRRKALALTWRTERLHVAIDKDPAAASMDITDISVAVDITPPSMPTGLMLVEDNKRTKSLFQLNSGSILVSLDWGLYNIAESILSRKEHFLELTQSSKPATDPISPSQFIGDELDRHDFHVVASSDLISIALQSINLRHRAQAEGLKLSLIGTTKSTEDDLGEAVCAVVNADAAVTELFGQSRCIWQTLLTLPSLYIDHVRPRTKTNLPPSVTIAAAYNGLQITVKDQIAGILQVVDSVIADEALQVQKLVDMSRTADEVVKYQKSISANAGLTPKFHVAMLAGTLQVDLALLSNLSYQLRCTSASIRVAPSLTADQIVAIDFDISDQVHAFVNWSRNEHQEQGLLNVPPINGHVGLVLANDVTDLSIALTIDQVVVDASAISGIVAVINRPEVSQVVRSVNESISDLKAHVSSLNLGSRGAESKKKEKSKAFLFDARFALFGVSIATTTPHANTNAIAKLAFGIGPLYAKAKNRPERLPDQTTRDLDILVQVKDVGASLMVREGNRETSCGNVDMGVILNFQSIVKSAGDRVRGLMIRIPLIEVNAFPETAPTMVDVVNHMQDRIKDIDLSKEVEYLRRLGKMRKGRASFLRLQDLQQDKDEQTNAASFTADLLATSLDMEIGGLQVSWLVAPSYALNPQWPVHDPVLTISRITLTAQDGNEAKLTIHNLMLQLVPKRQSKAVRSLNSALMPEISFSVAYSSQGKDKRLAFKATGRPLDLQVDTKLMFPISALQRSIEWSVEQFQVGTATWQSMPTSSGAPRANLFSSSKFVAILVEIDFAGAKVYLQDAGQSNIRMSVASEIVQQHGAQHGRYGQFAADGDLMNTTLVAPGIFLKLQYNDREQQSSLNGELMVEASKNMLLPNVVPLILQVSKTVKEVFQNQDGTASKPKPAESQANPQQRLLPDDALASADPEKLLGKMKIDFGVRICRQEFGLTCQPIARVDAKAELDDFYFTVNTIESEDLGRFFAVTAVVTKLSTTVKHVYSRDPTFSFEMDSIVLSMMNSRHLGGANGIAAILKLNPTRTSINAKQLQDLLVFREIWLPPEIRSTQPPQTQRQSQPSDSEDYLMMKYHSVSTAAAFPWHATIQIEELAVDLDLGQSIGKSSFTVTGLWASSQKSSNFEQNLCIGLTEMAVKGTGRMSGFISLDGFGVRTSIKWPENTGSSKKTPLVQAAVGFHRLRAKAAFDYQAFAFVDIEDFDFLMYNVRGERSDAKDRLVAILDGGKIYAFMTSTSPSQALGLYQAFERLIVEKQESYKQSLKDLEKYARRESLVVQTRHGPPVQNAALVSLPEKKTAISLHTDVILTLGTISVGAFPRTFFDSQLLKLEATNIQARFAVGLEENKIQSVLGMTLGQLQVALASVKKVAVHKTLGDVSIDDVVSSAVDSRGGTILRVPKVIATMQTWQSSDPSSNDANKIDYIFRSLFDGKIDVGWNLSRINFIKGMWMSGSRALSSRLGGKALPESAVKIRAGPQMDEGEDTASKERTQEKITAEVNLPQSRYEYRALEPPIIETPQLRDMGEATPPLEWIGLQRDRLPNVTHQIIIVSLLEIAKEVEDAYIRILGVS